MEKTLFEKIANREVESFIVWENDCCIAFLTPFPNTPGQVIVAPKGNAGHNFVDIAEPMYSELLRSSRKVAKIMQASLEVERIALVIEGTGIPHVHVKLYPMYGISQDSFGIENKETFFTEKYLGYITTKEGPKMSDEELENIAEKIRTASGYNN